MNELWLSQFPSLCSLSAIISFQTCSNKCILYVLLFHKCIKIKYKTVNMYGVFLWLVQSSSRWNTIHSHRNYHVQLLSVRVGEICHPADRDNQCNMRIVYNWWLHHGKKNVKYYATWSSQKLRNKKQNQSLRKNKGGKMEMGRARSKKGG